MRGTTVISFRNGGILPHYRTFQDTSQNMDFAAARAGVEFARSVCKRLATMGD